MKFRSIIADKEDMPSTILRVPYLKKWNEPGVDPVQPPHKVEVHLWPGLRRAREACADLSQQRLLVDALPSLKIGMKMPAN